MNLLTKEQIEIFSKHEREFYTVMNFDYKRNTPSRDCNQLAEIYESVTKETVTRNWNCSHCQMNAFKLFGKLYYASLDFYKEEEKKATEEPVQALNEVVEDKPTKKRTSKTKTAKK